MCKDISKRVCCTCLCEDRKLFPLCRVPDGVNLIYMLLMCDTEAYRAGFFKETASWLVCWECCAIIKKIQLFRLQACSAMKNLKDIAEGKKEELSLQSLSLLSIYKNPSTVIETDFVDCGSDLNKIKKENTDLYHIEDNHCYEDEPTKDEAKESLIKKEINKTNTKIFDRKYGNVPSENLTSNNDVEINKEIINVCRKEYTITTMDIEELKKTTDSRKLDLKNEFKCLNCVLEFEDDYEFNKHNLEVHSKKMLKKPIKSDKPVKYPCTECDMTFENKGAKWKHVQKLHRDGHKCGTCQKVFTFKHNLQRHQLSHTGPQPRTECPACHKQVRTSLLASHARTHAARARFSCAPCGKAFVCRATYETHLKYASAHAANSVLRHACAQCDKKYRSGGELRDHIAYRHDAQARHKCPVCDKFLATRRCLTRHVRRAHEGIKENARDKMCDYCGKAFRDKKSLVEHVSRHTGEKPHACGRCGRTFRQRAALYAHSRRLHAHT